MCRNCRRSAKSVLFSVGSEDSRSLPRPPFGKIGDAYVEAIYAYAKAHNIAVVRFQFEISDTYVFDRPQAGQM
jgi:hypothetical protein